MSLLPKVLIERPPSAPAKFGVLSAAVVRDSTDPHEAAGVTWDQEFCGAARTNLADCYTVETSLLLNVYDADQRVNYAGGSGPAGNCAGADLLIDFGDGTTVTSTAADLSADLDHTYAAPGDYTVTITSDAPCNVTGEIGITIADPPGDPDPHQVTLSLSYIPSTLTDDDRAGWAESDPFNLYHLSSCKLPGLTHDERVAYARRSLSAGEGRGIETHISQWFSSVQPGGHNVYPLASGAAASWTVALGRLEAYAFENYGGTAVIYMHRTVASVLLGECQLEVAGDKLVTKLGSLVVAGTGTDGSFPGAPDGEATDGGNTWMFATGTLLVTRGPITTTDEVISNSAASNDGSAAYTNEYLVLAARDASVGFECFIAAHQVLEVNDADLPSLAKDEV